MIMNKQKGGKYQCCNSDVNFDPLLFLIICLCDQNNFSFNVSFVVVVVVPMQDNPKGPESQHIAVFLGISILFL